MENKKLNGLSQKLNNLFKEYEIHDFEVSEIKLQEKTDNIQQRKQAKKCQIIRDPETGEYIMICEK